MFYVKDKIIEYPNKSILEDVLSRNGEPTEESFTPFNGCNHFIREQLHDSTNNVEIQDILRYAKDFSVHKAKPNDDINRDYDASQVVDYYTRLEDVDQVYIENYVIQTLIGYKRNVEGLRKIERELQIVPRWYDKDSETMVSVSDIEIKEILFSTEEILEAKEKLPYLLKQLHNGSILCKGSLLSFIIAAEKCFRNHENEKGYNLVPRDIVSEGVYKMNVKGEITSRFNIKENTGETLRDLIAWVCGKVENDLYYRSYQELMKVLSVLDLDITKEDARNYNGEYISKIVCTYLASNEEYLETYGYVDRKILSMLSPDKLFTVASKVSEESVTPARLSVNILADSIATNTEILRFKSPKEWKNRVKLVNEFLEFYCTKIIQTSDIKQVTDYDVYKGLLRKSDGTYVTINVSNIVDYYSSRAVLAVVSIAGYLIIVEDFDVCIQCLDLESAMDYFGGYYDDKEWRQVYI